MESKNQTKIVALHQCSKIDGKKTASEIVKSVNLLMAIQWGKQAWDEISADTIKKCFEKVGLVPDGNTTKEDDDDPFMGEDMLSCVQSLFKGQQLPENS